MRILVELRMLFEVIQSCEAIFAVLGNCYPTVTKMLFAEAVANAQRCARSIFISI